MELSAQQMMVARNAALFAAATKAPTLTNLLTGPAPKGTSDIGKKQTEPGSPIVRIQDLEKQPGREVTVDLFHDITKRPTMGDKKLAGRGDTLTSSSHSLKVNQARHMVDDGGKFIQSTTAHNIPEVAKKALRNYWTRFDEETTTYHLLGARGDVMTSELIVPTENDPEFAEIMVNPVLPPTAGRHFFAGDATSFESIDGLDLFSLATLSNLALYLEEMSNPLQKVALTNDKAMYDGDPFYVYFATPRQYRDAMESASGKDFQMMQATAMERSKGFNSPLFKGECFMVNNILVRKMSNRVRFNQGSQVRVCKNDLNATEEIKVAGTTIERGVLLGAQALAVAWGSTKGGTQPFNIHSEPTDHGNTMEFSIQACQGKQALRFRNRDGILNCHGRIIVDSAVKL